MRGRICWRGPSYTGIHASHACASSTYMSRKKGSEEIKGREWNGIESRKSGGGGDDDWKMDTMDSIHMCIQVGIVNSKIIGKKKGVLK